MARDEEKEVIKIKKKIVKDEDLVSEIIEQLDATRMDLNGGYPSDWLIERGKLYWADLDAGKEYNAPVLRVMSVKEFFEQFPPEDWLDQ